MENGKVKSNKMVPDYSAYGKKRFFVFCIFCAMLFPGKASSQSLLKEFGTGDGRFCTTTVYLLEDSLFGIESGCEGRSRFTYGKYGKEGKNYVLYPYRSGGFEVIADIELVAYGEEPADTLEIFFVSQDDSAFTSYIQFADSYATADQWQNGDSAALTEEPVGGLWQSDLPGYQLVFTARETQRICFTALADLTGQRITAAVPENVRKVVVHVELPYALLSYVSGFYQSVYQELNPGTMTLQQQVFEIR